MPHIVVTIVSFIVLLAIMVIVHELGHFIAAKIFKVRVEAFSVGMGPRLFGIKYGETDYRVCAFPIGGYVMMTGENMPGDNLGAKTEEEAGAATQAEEQAAQGNGEPDPGALTSKPRWQRMIIGFAGPLANFIFAFVVMVSFYWQINEVQPFFYQPVTLDLVSPNTAAANAGLQSGDKIVAVGSTENPTYEQFVTMISPDIGHSVPLTVERGNQTLHVDLSLPFDPNHPEDFSPMKLGIIPQEQSGPIGVQEVMGGQPASNAGLEAGDKVVKADGYSIHSVEALLPYLQAQQGKPIRLTIDRKGKTMELTAHPEKLGTDETGGVWRLGFRPVPVSVINKPLSLGESMQHAVAFCENNAFVIVKVLGKVLTHQISAKTLSGPIGMAQMAGDVAETPGVGPKFYLGAEISLNLGILNLLPIPILDGGLIFLLLIESIRRKDLSMNIKERIYQVAFVFLMVLMVFIIYNDISKFTFFRH